MPEVGEVLGARRGYVIAPAGCGKTELIADSVAASDRRNLVLTHTHAGVGALRARLRAKGVPPRRFSVETITGFCLRFAASYPTSSGWSQDKPTGKQWDDVQLAATRLFSTGNIGRVLRASFERVLVDEYQDCTAVQHELTMTLASELPTVVLGDPLQGIFRFAGPPVDWDDLDKRFEKLGELETPHRWRSTNPELGEWLLDARRRLLSNSEPDWDASVVTTGESTSATQVITCNRFRETESVVAIRKWQRDEQDVASRLGGTFSSMETIEAKDLFLAADVFDSATGTELAASVVGFAAVCMTGVRSHLRSAEDRLESGAVPAARAGAANEAAVRAVADVVERGVDAVPTALRAIASLNDVRIYRHELLEETIRAIQLRRPTSERSLSELAWDLREDARRRGRAVPPRVVSRTLLVKGLEFDHAIVLARRELNREELYVAITRPRRSLTVLV